MLKIFTVFFSLTMAAFLQAGIPELRAVKITNVDSDILFSDEAIAEGMAYLASININTVLIVVWNGNSSDGVRTLYPSAVMDSLIGEPIHPSFSGRDPLQTVIVEAHKQGMYVLPWFEMGFSSSWSSTYEEAPDALLRRYPHWASRTEDGKITWKNGFYWLNTIHPEVQKLLRDLTLEVCRNYDIDGIEYSDRIPALPVEGGYDEYTAALYRSEHNGSSPPSDPRDTDWKRWRADKLNDWFRDIRDAVKFLDADLHISSSPSVYPWSYNEYLQDPKTWMTEGICDDIIPQLYRKTFAEYLPTLEASLENYPGMRDSYAAGIVLYQRYSDFTGEEYIMPADYMRSMMETNREKGIRGEAWFFYEGFRKFPHIGDTLTANWYSEPVPPPFISRNTVRDPFMIVEESDSNVVLTGSWTDYDRIPHHGTVLKYTPIGSGAAAEVQCAIPETADYNIYIYNTRQINGSRSLPVVVYHDSGTDTITVNQKDPAHTGWTRIGCFSFNATGDQVPVLKWTSDAPDGSYAFADAVALAKNLNDSFRISAGTAVTEYPMYFPERLSGSISPNPANSRMVLNLLLPTPGTLKTEIFDITGRHVLSLSYTFSSAGEKHIPFDLDAMTSGIYILRSALTSGNHISLYISKLSLIK